MALQNTINYNTFSNSVLTTGATPFNTAVGVTNLTGNSGGTNNTGVGYQALHSLTTGAQNTAVGAFGALALASNTVGANNTAIGTSTLPFAVADDTIAIGNAALNNLNSGRGNTLSLLCASANTEWVVLSSVGNWVVG